MTDQKAIATLTTDLLRAIGEDPDREGLVGTPLRVARYWAEMTEGYRVDEERLFDAVFESPVDEMVIVRAIPFYSLCEHHLVPFHGTVSIGYIPAGRVLGLSKFARLANVYAKRLQIQERMTAEIADAIDRNLSPLGVAVQVRARHLCMEMRGCRTPGETVTNALRGVFLERAEARAEFLEAVR